MNLKRLYKPMKAAKGIARSLEGTLFEQKTFSKLAHRRGYAWRQRHSGDIQGAQVFVHYVQVGNPGSGSTREIAIQWSNCQGELEMCGSEKIEKVDAESPRTGCVSARG